jgi:hypothetical protein
MNSLKVYNESIEISELKSTSSQPYLLNDKKPNKKLEMQHSSILFTNDMYKKKMNKTKKEIEYETFENNASFNSFIDKGINDIYQMNWKQIPLCTKYSISKHFVQNDDSLSDIAKNDYLLKFDNNIMNNGIVYDRLSGKIKSINYKLFTA